MIASSARPLHIGKGPAIGSLTREFYGPNCIPRSWGREKMPRNATRCKVFALSTQLKWGYD